MSGVVAEPAPHRWTPWLIVANVHAFADNLLVLYGVWSWGRDTFQLLMIGLKMMVDVRRPPALKA